MAFRAAAVTVGAVTGGVRHVLIGREAAFGRPGLTSAIAKRAVERPVAVSRFGLAGDEQADRRIHGGPDKAVHLYAWEHYDVWRRELALGSLFDDAGAFGENLSVVGINEAQVCIADRWRIGGTVLQVTQGRQPCWKLNLRFGVDDMAARVQRSLRAGWYCSVVQPGVLAAGDAMMLVDRPYPMWSVARLLALIRDRECSAPVIGEVLELPLTPSWRKLFLLRLQRGQAENWDARMGGG